MTPRPFIKWAGGKTQLLPEIRKFVPKKFGTYHEPFLGGGAVFFDLRPEMAILSDVNAEIVELYVQIRRNWREVAGALLELGKASFSRETYEKVRSWKPARPAWRAARTIYLNKTGFNGLYRVNKAGEFNVPWGKKGEVRLFDFENLAACSEALRTASLRGRSFEESLQSVKSGDFVYMDPPYAPLNAASFTAYTALGFSMEDQRRVRDEACRVADLGATVLLSNSDTPEVRELYRDFYVHPVQARRSINANGGGRKKIGELLISSCTPPKD